MAPTQVRNFRSNNNGLLISTSPFPGGNVEPLMRIRAFLTGRVEESAALGGDGAGIWFRTWDGA